MVKNLFYAWVLAGILLAVVLTPAPAVLHAASTPSGTVAQQEGQCVKWEGFGNPPNSTVKLPPPMLTNISNLLLYSINTSYLLPPGGCALYSFILVNTSTQAENWYQVWTFMNAPGVMWYLIPASQLNLFFSSDHTEGYAMVGGTNESVSLANPKPNAEWYVYAVNTGAGDVSFDLTVGGYFNLLPMSGVGWEAVNLAPGESLSFIYFGQSGYVNILGGANSSTVEWTVTVGGKVVYSESGIDPNTSTNPSSSLIQGGIRVHEPFTGFTFNATNTGTSPVYVVVVAQNDGLINIVVNGPGTASSDQGPSPLFYISAAAVLAVVIAVVAKAIHSARRNKSGDPVRVTGSGIAGNLSSTGKTTPRTIAYMIFNCLRMNP